ncbi:MAG: DNA repair and recombination protein RadB [Nanoarchaeota archaeon]|nr:DNA repair and recombination protein RadB [Nanoarchaeota archaeon]
MVKVSAGSYDLNKWLHGGYESDIVSVIYGGSGSGKTNFCLLAAVSQAKKGNKVIYVDTEGGFSVDRVKQLAFEESDVVLKNIFLLNPTNFQEQQEAFEKINEFLKKEVSLIIVDGMTILYRLDFAEAREKNNGSMGKINSELVRQIKTLAEIARKRNIPIIVTNQVYNWEDDNGKEKRMVGGDILKYWSKCHIELNNAGGKRTAYLRKHRSLAEKEMEFQIVNSGVKKKGWL